MSDKYGSKVFNNKSIKFWDNIEIIENNRDDNLVYRSIKLYNNESTEEINIKEFYDNYNRRTYKTDDMKFYLFDNLFNFDKINYIEHKKPGNEIILADGISIKLCILFGDNYQHSLLIYKKIQKDNFKLIKSYKMSAIDIINLINIYLES